MTAPSHRPVLKLRTGITGFDAISNGGIPQGRNTLLAGTAGSLKTVFAVQFLACGVSLNDESCVFVTFEETPEDIRQNMLSFGWDIAAWEAAGKWAFVDASPRPEAPVLLSAEYDLATLLARIQHAIDKVGASRVSIDSLGAIFGKFDNHHVVRGELLRISVALKKTGVTSLMTVERNQEYGDIARHGIEEFVADNVIILRNVLEAESRRRTMKILKFRGTDHRKGEHPFSIVADGGIVGVFTSVTPTLMGGTSITKAHISTVTDTIILLRYVELFGEISRGIAVLKMRSSRHEKEIREFNIDHTCMHVGKPFRNTTGILTGNPQYHQIPESERLQEMFEDV